jgi:hypothetical protein
MQFSIRKSVLILTLITLINADLNDRLDCYLESKSSIIMIFSLILRYVINNNKRKNCEFILNEKTQNVFYI